MAFQGLFFVKKFDFNGFVGYSSKKINFMARMFHLIFFALMFPLSVFAGLQNGGATIHVQVLQGEAIEAYAKAITDLSLTVYREYPYLYEGTEEEYLPFIQDYAQSTDGLACLLFHDETLVGVAIGMPMSAMRENYRQIISRSSQGIDIDSMFYLGEFLLLEEYRDTELAAQMYFEFEQSIKSKKTFRAIYYCKIIESDMPIQKPANYKSVDDFLFNLGFEQQENLDFTVFWRNVDEVEDSPHRLVYLMKSLSFSSPKDS